MHFRSEENLTTASRPTRMLDDRQRKALRLAISVFRTEWTRNHLLGVEPLTDAALLSSPLQQMHALTFECGLTLNQHDPQPDFNAMMSWESVMIPAFNKNGFNLGYVLGEAYGLFSEEDCILCGDGIFVSRFVNHEKSGTYIAVADLPKSDLLVSISLTNWSCIVHNFGFPIGSLRRLIAAKVADISVFERSLCTVISAENPMNCVKCDASFDTCSCTKKFSSAKSPLDLESVKQNMIQLHFGIREGKGVYETFEDGVSNQTMSMDGWHSNIQISGVGPAKRILNHVIGDVLKNLSIGFTRSLSSPLCTANNITAPVLDTDEIDCASHTLPDVLPSNTAITSNVIPNPSYSEEPTNFLNVGTVTNSSYIGNTALNVDPLWPWNLSHSSPTITTRKTSPISPIITTVVATEPTPKYVAKKRTEKQVKPIAPRGATDMHQSSPDVTAMSEEKMRKTADELRAWKAFQRKIRNRESAARSNKARRQRLRLEREKKRNAAGPVSA